MQPPAIDVLIAALGNPPRGYQTSNYVWQGRRHSTPYCVEALVNFLSPARLVLLVTKKARQGETDGRNNLADLEQRVTALGSQLIPVDIPEDGSEASLWLMFNRCVDQISVGEQVAFDVTYGFRFIPMLMLLAGQFLTVAKGVRPAGIYYGAWDATDDAGNTPILDLISFAELMNWSQAAAHFVETGNAGPLLRGMERIEDPSLRKLHTHLHDTSQALRLGMAPQVGKTVATLMDTLADPPTESQSDSDSAPVRALFQPIADKYRPLGLTEDMTPEYAAPHLRQQAALISWYVRHELVLQAALLTREWLVTWVVMELGEPSLLQSEYRLNAAQLLADAAGNDRLRRQQAKHDLANVRRNDQVIRLWNQCVNVRNQLAHMSFRPSGTRQNYRVIMQTLRSLQQGITNIAAELPEAPEVALQLWNPWAE